jgi:hypothetical protein
MTAPTAIRPEVWALAEAGLERILEVAADQGWQRRENRNGILELQPPNPRQVPFLVPTNPAGITGLLDVVEGLERRGLVLPDAPEPSDEERRIARIRAADDDPIQFGFRLPSQSAPTKKETPMGEDAAPTSTLHACPEDDCVASFTTPQGLCRHRLSMHGTPGAARQAGYRKPFGKAAAGDRPRKAPAPPATNGHKPAPAAPVEADLEDGPPAGVYISVHQMADGRLILEHPVDGGLFIARLTRLVEEPA